MSHSHPLLLAFSLRDRLAVMSWLEMVLWIGMASLTVALLVLMGTRWGQVRPVSKCVALSVFAHVLFLAYAYGTNLSFNVAGFGLEPTVRVSLTGAGEDEDSDLASPVDVPPEAADLSPTLPVETPPASLPTTEPPLSVQPSQLDPPKLLAAADPPPSEPPPLLPDPEQPAPTETTAEPVVETPMELPAEAPEVIADSTPPVPTEFAADKKPEIEIAAVPQPENVAMDSTQSEVVESNPFPIDSNPPVPREVSRTDNTTASVNPPQPQRRSVDDQPLPEPYRLRGAENRLQLAIPFGATETSEAAVEAALAWLASVQSSDGRWDASDFGAGRETKTLGHDRQGAGQTADMGISGLALLAFLGAGNTHVKGNYRETVQHGLEFLLREQAADGNLAGPARLFEKMYCHGIAALALGEAFALTGDPRLQPALKRAVAYSVSSQHPSSGGWRYQPGDRGDVSQFGWQVMALRSAELGGLALDERTHSLMLKFLESATTGRHKGLASYRAGERATRTMTAEAMACRFFLQVPPSSASAIEATDFVMQELPGSGQPNLYYWYYATLALFQNQGPAWQTWNDALQRQLITRQRQDGRLAGSWDTDDVWGGYGGRVYTTAMGALCLEVYYRYLPLYVETERHAEAVRSADPLRR
jgi:hypothetical protein